MDDPLASLPCSKLFRHRLGLALEGRRRSKQHQLYSLLKVKNQFTSLWILSEMSLQYSAYKRCEHCHYNVHFHLLYRDMY